MAEQITTQDDDLFSEDLVRSYLSNPRFLRRDWLAAEVNEQLEKPDCRFVLIAAEPGAGKSTFMAQLAADHPDWPRYFIRRDQRTPLGDVGAHSFLLRIGYQLAARYPEAFAQKNLQLAVQHRIGSAEAGSEAVAVEVNRIIASPFYSKVVSIRQDVERSGGRVVGLKVKELFIERQLLDLSKLLNMAIIDPAHALLKLRPKDRIVILVDALDEIRYQNITENILDWLTNCPDLPPNVCFVLSSRPPDETIKFFCAKQAPHLSRLTIAEEDLRVKGDIEQFLNRLVGEPEIAQALQEAEGGAESFGRKAIDKARGNLGYLGALARGIDRTVDEMKAKEEDTRLCARRMLDALLSLNELPADLEGLYAFFLKQIKVSVARERIKLMDPDTGETYYIAVWSEVYQPILRMLAVAAEPLDLELIERLGGIRAERNLVSDALDRLSQFLDVIDGRYRLYHATVAEFLTAPDTKSSTETADLYVDAVHWHGQIATYYWTRFHTDWLRCDDAYGLNSLSTHLYRGGQFERLAELISQPWMIARFNAGGYTYDGFIADLTLAWGYAQEETHHQIEARQAPRALAQCVRYALIRTSINSLSGNYAPKLVSRAVETGFWAPERALSVAARAPDARQRSAMFSALLATGKLSGAHLIQAQREGLAATQTIDSKYDRVVALAGLAPHLNAEDRQQALREGLAVIEDIDDLRYRARALADLAPHLNSEARQQALRQELEAAQAIADEQVRAGAVAALAPHLTGDLLEPGLKAALGIADKQVRAGAVADLAPQLEGETRQQVLKQELEAALAIGDEGVLAWVLITLAPHLTGDLLQQGLKAAQAIGDNAARAMTLARLAPQLEGETRQQVLKQGLEAALAVGDERRAWALYSLARQLKGETRQHALKQGLEAALAIGNEQVRTDVLADLAPQLTGDLLRHGLAAALPIRNRARRAYVLSALAPQLAGELLKQGLEAAQAIGDEGDRAWALARLAPHLEGENRQKALQQGLKAAVVIGDERHRPEALGAMAFQLTGYLLQQELAVAQAIDDEELRGRRALAALAPQLTGDLLKQGVEAALAIGNEGAWAEALAALAPQLEGETRQQVLKQGLEAALAQGDEGNRAWALATLAPHLTGELLQKGLEAAQAIGNEGARVKVLLAALAPQLTGELLQQGLAAALAHGFEGARDWVFALLAPQLTSDLLEAAKAIGIEGARVKTLSALAPQLKGETRQQALQQGLAAAQAIGCERAWAWALSALAPHLTGELLQKGLEAAQAIGDDWARATALTALAPHLTGELLQKGLEAAQAIGDDWARATALTALAPQLTGELLKQGLKAAQAISFEWARAKALAALAPQLEGETRQQVLKQGLEAAQAIGDEGAQAWALAALAPHLSGELLKQGLEAAQVIADDGARVEVLSALAPQLKGETSQHALQQGLEAALATDEDRAWEHALTKLAPFMSDQEAVSQQIRRAMADHLWRNLMRHTRRRLLISFCADHFFVTPPLLDSDILAAIAGHISEICTEWRWP